MAPTGSVISYGPLYASLLVSNVPHSVILALIHSSSWARPMHPGLVFDNYAQRTTPPMLFDSLLIKLLTNASTVPLAVHRMRFFKRCAIDGQLSWFGGIWQYASRPRYPLYCTSKSRRLEMNSWFHSGLSQRRV